MMTFTIEHRNRELNILITPARDKPMSGSVFERGINKDMWKADIAIVHSKFSRDYYLQKSRLAQPILFTYLGTKTLFSGVHASHLPNLRIYGKLDREVSFTAEDSVNINIDEH